VWGWVERVLRRLDGLRRRGRGWGRVEGRRRHFELLFWS
jgi:hypothetical protein